VSGFWQEICGSIKTKANKASFFNYSLISAFSGFVLFVFSTFNLYSVK